METLKTEKIEATEMSMEANIITIDSAPSIEQQNELFGDDDSIILEF